MTVSSSAATVEPDSYFNLVSLLLPGNGTNGAQNNTFLDSSTNNFTVTRNGNTTQGTFSPFSQTGWSNYFDGSGDYLNKTSGTITLSGDFTLEYWMYPTSVGSYPTTYSTFNAIAVASAMYAQFALNGTTFTFSCGNGSSDGAIGSYTATLNQWQHHAIVRSGTTVTAYVNGVSVGTRTSSVAFNLTSLGIGAYTGAQAGNYPFFGYISNFRVVNGTAVYTSNFAVPTTPLTAISGTSLLTCQSNRFVDNSANAFALTVNGNVSVQPFSPFNPTAAYSAATVGGSGYFDGSGDYLDAGAQTAFAFGTGSWTVEAWVYVTSLSSEILLFDTRSSVSTAGVGCRIGTDGTLSYSGSANNPLTSTAIKTNEWNHIAWSYDGTTLSGYINGVRGGTATPSFNISQNNGIVGRVGFTAASYMSGYISSLRVVKGSAVYSGTSFSVPTAPLTAISGTSLLLSGTNGGITDAAAKNVLETVGGAAISTAQSKWGGSAMYFDGNGDYLTIPNNVLFALGTGDFTIECWVYSIAGSNNGVWQLASSAFPGSAGLAVAANGGAWTVYYGSTSQGHGFGSIGTGTWQHVALVRQSGSLYIYSNGVKYTVAASDTTNYTYTTLVIGGYYSTSFLWNGYINDLRITRGYARYTANFTPPTAAFPTQ